MTEPEEKVNSNSERISHLQLIQAVITRMANNSFLLKGWSITIIVGVFIFFTKDTNNKIAFVPLLPTFVFWILDSYYLRQERLFRKLYDKIRNLSTDGVYQPLYFSMNTSIVKDEVDSLFKVLFSATEWLFYLPLLIIQIAIILLIYV